MLYVRSPKFTHLTDWRFVLFDQHLPSSPTPTLLVTSILLSASMSFAFWDFVYKWYHTVFIFLHLAKFTYTLRVYSCCKWQDVLVSHGWKKSQGTHTHTSHIIFICSSDRHVSCFHVVSIVNNSAVNKGLEIFFSRSSYFISFGHLPSSEVTGSNGSSSLNCLSNPHTLFHCDCTNLHSQKKVHKGSLFSTASPTYVISCLFW